MTWTKLAQKTGSCEVDTHSISFRCMVLEKHQSCTRARLILLPNDPIAHHRLQPSIERDEFMDLPRYAAGKAHHKQPYNLWL